MAKPQVPPVTATRVTTSHSARAMSTQEILSRIEAMYADRDEAGDRYADLRGPNPG